MKREQEFATALEKFLEECNEFIVQCKQSTEGSLSTTEQQFFDELQELVPAIEKITSPQEIVLSENSEVMEYAIVDPFEVLLKDYNEACAAGTLTGQLAKELITELKAVIRKQVEGHSSMSKAYKTNKDITLKQKLIESAQLIRSRKATLEALDTNCIKGEVDIIIDVPFEDLMLVSEIDQVYEEVIEEGIKMSTGSNADIAASYKKAMDRFVELYNEAHDGLKSKWKQAKKEVDKNILILKTKTDTAAATIQGFQTQMRATGIRGYFRYGEGVVNGELVRRMDWVMASTGAFVATLNGEGRDGEIIIENYILTGDDQGDLVYTHSGKVTKLTSHIFELASKLVSPFYSDEESYDMKPGAGQPFSGNQAGADRNSSIMLRTALIKAQPNVVEIPDWTDGRIRELIDEYNRRCAAGMSKTEAKRLKAELLNEIKIDQGGLIDKLNVIHNEQGERKDTAALLSIWRKKMKLWENEVNNLGMNCMGKIVSPEPCKAFSETMNKYTVKCTEKKLTPVEAQKLRDEMQDCIDNSRLELKEFDKKIQILREMREKEKKNAGSTYKPDLDLENEINKLENDYRELDSKIQEEENELTSLEPYSEDNCISFRESNKSYDIPFRKGKYAFKKEPQKIVDLQEIVAILQKNPKNKAILQPRTSDPKSALFGLIDGVALVKGRKKTLEDYFKGLGLSKQVTIIVNDNSYNADWDVQGTIQEYDYDID